MEIKCFPSKVSLVNEVEKGKQKSGTEIRFPFWIFCFTEVYGHIDVDINLPYLSTKKIKKIINNL